VNQFTGQNVSLELHRTAARYVGTGPEYFSWLSITEYCKPLYSHCVLISRFWSVEILWHLAYFSPGVLKSKVTSHVNRNRIVFILAIALHTIEHFHNRLVFYADEFLVLGKLKFRMYLISRFYPIREEYVFYSEYAMLCVVVTWTIVNQY